jgi:type 2A phosphatase activator TIP41
MATNSIQTVFPAQSSATSDASEVLAKSTPVAHVLNTTRSSRSITIHNDWTITSAKLPISSSSSCDELASQIGIPMPEMTFGGNSVCIEGPKGWKCEFNTREALDLVDKTGSQGIKVSYSEQWNKTRYLHTSRHKPDWKGEGQ